MINTSCKRYCFIKKLLHVVQNVKNFIICEAKDKCKLSNNTHECNKYLKRIW